MTGPRLVLAVLVFLQHGAAAECEGATCAGEDSDASALLALHRHVTSSKTHGQRADDLVPVPPNPVVKPPPFKHTLPIPEPKPVRPYANDPFLKDYVPQGCKEAAPIFQNLEGRWTGENGLSFSTLPQADAKKLFFVQVNEYRDDFNFTTVEGVLNRGYANATQIFGQIPGQGDQVFAGVHFKESVFDKQLKTGIHEESGFFLRQSCRPDGADAFSNWDAMRASFIPHGAQPMAFGNTTRVEPPTSDYYVQMLIRLRDTYKFSGLPHVSGCGSQFEQQRAQDGFGLAMPTGTMTDFGCCLPGPGYITRGAADVCPETGCPEPIDNLIQAVKDLNIVEYESIELTTKDVINSDIPRGKFEHGFRGGGVTNTPFVNFHVENPQRTFHNNIWLLTVRRDDGSYYQLLQFIQVVDFLFLQSSETCPMIAWPHVQANTLVRADAEQGGRCISKWCKCDATGMKSTMGPRCQKSEHHCDLCWGRWCSS